jgi:hypothetical protein
MLKIMMTTLTTAHTSEPVTMYTAPRGSTIPLFTKTMLAARAIRTGAKTKDTFRHHFIFC